MSAKPAAVLLVLLLSVSSGARAALDYELQTTRTKLDLEGEFEDEQRSSATSQERHEETDSFEQGLEIEGEGWLYHPDLLSFDFGLEPSWRQERTDATGDFDRDDDITFFGYFLDAIFLRQKPQSAGLFLRQSRNTFHSTLSPNNTTETDIARATWHLKEYRVPTRFTLEHNDTKFEDFYTTRDESNSFRFDSILKTERSSSNASGEWTNQDRRIGEFGSSTDRLMLNANNTFRFTENYRLMSSFSGIESQSNETDSAAYLLAERLQLQHRPNLSTDHEVRFDKREHNGSDSSTTLLSSFAQHLLYENLTTNAGVQLSRDEFENGRIDQVEPQFDFRYTRRIPGGRIGATAGYKYRYEDNDFDETLAQRIGEPHTVEGISPLLLDEVGVVIASIEVTDATSSIIYLEGIDYTVVIIGDSIAIEPTLFGGIADGQTLLVNYEFATQAPFESDFNQVAFGINVDLWNAFRAYYNVSRGKEELISGTRPVDLADDTIQRYGLGLRYPWSTTSIEWEDRDTTRTPLKRFRATQSFHFPIGGAALGLYGGYTDTNFREQLADNDTTSIDVGVTLRWNLGPWGQFEGRAFSREVDGTSQQTRYEGLLARWAWRYGAWSGSVRFETVDESDDLTLQEHNRDVFTINVSRLF